MSNSPELLPCPFCGADLHQPYLKNPEVYAHPKGSDCFAGKAIVHPERYEQWNTRADAALAEIDAVQVKPLIWYGKPDHQNIRIGRCGEVSYSVGFKMGLWGYRRRGEGGHTASYMGGAIFTCEADAIDGADIDHKRRALAVIEPAPQSEIDAVREENIWLKEALAKALGPPKLGKWQVDVTNYTPPPRFKT